MYLRSSLLLLKSFSENTHPSCIYSADGSLACFQFGAIVIRVAMVSLAYVTRCFYAPGCMPASVKSAGHGECVCSISADNVPFVGK